MACPRCQFAEPTPTDCPRCGVVFAKLDRPKPASRLEPAPIVDEPPGRRLGALDAALLAASLGALAMIGWRWNHPEPPAEDRVASMEATEGQPARLSAPARRTLRIAPAVQPPTAIPQSQPWPGTANRPPARTEAWQVAPAAGLRISAEDAATYTALSRALSTGNEVEASLVDQAATLHGHYPNLADVDRIVEGVLDLAAQQANGRGRSDEAARYCEQAADLFPEHVSAWRRWISYLEQQRAWPAAERAARRSLSALPDESALHMALARSLSQQGRDEEAADVLRRRLTARNDPAARAYLAQLERALASVAGLAHQSSSHFSVSFEGQPDDALGRALVQTLEEKHAMLARTLDYEPTQAVPVILYPRETFLQTGAPAWSGANFSHGDGRIRVGTRDLSAGFVPLDLERTLTHELTHAFVFGRTRGALPLTLNEGLAQYLSGRRLGYRLDPGRVATTGERVKVDDFYDSALSFVEYLIDRYRQATINEVLKYTGETGSVEQAFRRALHQGYEETRQEWIKSLRS
jgi:tetratricopeptide (TPR) repeat protein